jgi:hypothetical protein
VKPREFETMHRILLNLLSEKENFPSSLGEKVHGVK